MIWVQREYDTKVWEMNTISQRERIQAKRAYFKVLEVIVVVRCRFSIGSYRPLMVGIGGTWNPKRVERT